MNRKELIEIFMAYGWAIIVVITSISALIYFGILNDSDDKPFILDNETCVNIAKVDYNYSKPVCKPSEVEKNVCFCEEFVIDVCEKWEYKEHSKRCLKYKYSYMEFQLMKKPLKFWVNISKLNEVNR